MLAFRTLLVWLLTAVWLPATLHCAMEQAGWWAEEDACCAHDQTGERSPFEHCASDPCAVLESSLVKSGASPAKAPSPQLVLLFVVRPTDVLAMDPMLWVASAHADPPPELPRSWQFHTRAAPPARAPGRAS